MNKWFDSKPLEFPSEKLCYDWVFTQDCVQEGMQYLMREYSKATDEMGSGKTKITTDEYLTFMENKWRTVLSRLERICKNE